MRVEWRCFFSMWRRGSVNFHAWILMMRCDVVTKKCYLVLKTNYENRTTQDMGFWLGVYSSALLMRWQSSPVDGRFGKKSIQRRARIFSLPLSDYLYRNIETKPDLNRLSSVQSSFAHFKCQKVSWENLAEQFAWDEIKYFCDFGKKGKERKFARVQPTMKCWYAILYSHLAVKE